MRGGSSHNWEERKMNDEWRKETLCALGDGLELSRAAAAERYRLRLHIGRWTESGRHIRWTGWLKPSQLRSLYGFLTEHREVMEEPAERE